MRTMRRKDLVLWAFVFFVGLVGVFVASMWAFAAEGEPGTPWDDVRVTFGLVTFAWASIQMGAINILKGISIQGKGLLDTREKIWLANALLGVLGITLSATQAGTPLLVALLQATLVVFGSVGIYESPMVQGKKESVPIGIESTGDGSTPRPTG